jgi:hypothetical protein
VRRTRTRLFTENGPSLARTWQLNVEDEHGKWLLFALRRKDCAAISEALSEATRPR